MARIPISVTILTYQEEAFIEEALKSVLWADEWIVVDSGSTDRTCEIAKRLGAKVLQQPWRGYGAQKNFAQAQARFDWVLNIDADERVTKALKEELEQKLETIPEGVYGFSIPRKTFYRKKWIRHGGWYPNQVVRFVHRAHARWTEPKLHEALIVQGQVWKCQAPLEHWSFLGIEDQVRRNLKYAQLGAQMLKEQGKKTGWFSLVWKPFFKFFESYVLKRGFLDGFEGFVIAVNAAYSVFLKIAFSMEERS